jgi:2,3-bisphosphoglycerate-dependent phosphoglycerate mutase
MEEYRIVLLRHGESVWNKENRFTGWTDVDLSENGIQEAHDAGTILTEKGFTFDVAFTSFLLRATRTLDIVLKEMQLEAIPVHKAWQLNEKHYGALQGLYKKKTAEEHGEEQVFKWRRVYDVRPPALEPDDHRHPKKDPLYKTVDPSQLPATESLKDVVARFTPYWKKTIVPYIRDGKRIIISAHGNSLRALVKYMEDIPDEEISSLNIPTGIPLVYTLDVNMRPIHKEYLGDPERIKKATQAVANQGKTQ